jgi:hypothetical protein
MPKKSALKTTLITILIALGHFCTQAQDSLYTLPIWRARLLFEDAFKKRIQDTLIDSLDSRVQILEAEKKMAYNSFNEQIKAHKESVRYYREITDLERSLKEYERTEKRKYKYQRNLGIAGVVTYVVIRVGVKVFKPP